MNVLILKLYVDECVSMGMCVLSFRAIKMLRFQILIFRTLQVMSKYFFGNYKISNHINIYMYK